VLSDDKLSATADDRSSEANPAPFFEPDRSSFGDSLFFNRDVQVLE
jgi:hypothetical protein